MSDVIGHCPSCGSHLRKDHSGQCRECGHPVTLGERAKMFFGPKPEAQPEPVVETVTEVVKEEAAADGSPVS